MSETPPPRPVPADPLPPGVDPGLLDAAGHVAGDRSCHQCGYNLRTLAAAGLCPECATPVAESVQRSDLAHAPTAWLDQLATGAACLAWACGLFVGLLLGALGQWTLSETPTGWGAGGWGSLVVLFVAAGIAAGVLAGPLVWLSGVLALTSRDPREGRSCERWTSRRLARWSLFGLATPFVAFFLAALGVGESLAIGLIGLMVLAGLTGLVCVLHHARQLARRLPDPPLASYFGWAVVGCLCVAGLGTFAFLLSLSFAHRDLSDTCALIFVLGVALLLVLGGVGFFRLYRHLAELLRNRSRITHGEPR